MDEGCLAYLWRVRAPLFRNGPQGFASVTAGFTRILAHEGAATCMRAVLPMILTARVVITISL
jgi:hypothetical protein